jgi:hypothetical protein
MNSTDLKVALLFGLGLLCVLVVGVGAGWFFWRNRRSPSSRFGFTPARRQPENPAPASQQERRDETFIRTEKFIRQRGQRVVEVLIDYVGVKGLKQGVYVARPRPNSCIWWIGDKYPNAPRTVVAAVHVGLGTVHGFRAKVVVLSDASEVDVLARALGRAAKPLARPTRSDAWNVPIAFPGFPLRSGDGIEITELRAPAVGSPVV